MEKIRVITLFSGYDSQCLALERLKRNYSDFDYDLVAWCEIDKDAIAAHDALFPQWKDRNLGDITQVNPKDIPDCDLITWSFPCTDISSAGRQEGLQKGSGTRSSLAWDAIRIFEAKKPKFLLMENVQALVQKKFIKDFHKILSALHDIGYESFTEILNSKDYGVPQNRPRVFCTSVLRTENDQEPKFYFPEPFPLEKKLKDVLEDDADEKYYLSNERMAEYFEEDEEEETDSPA